MAAEGSPGVLQAGQHLRLGRAPAASPRQSALAAPEPWPIVTRRLHARAPPPLPPPTKGRCFRASAAASGAPGPGPGRGSGPWSGRSCCWRRAGPPATPPAACCTRAPSGPPPGPPPRAPGSAFAARSSCSSWPGTRESALCGNPLPADAGLGGTPGTVCPPSPEPLGFVTPHPSPWDPHIRDTPFFLMGGLLGFAGPPGLGHPFTVGHFPFLRGAWARWDPQNCGSPLFGGEGSARPPGPCPPFMDPPLLGMLDSAGLLGSWSPNRGVTVPG